MNPFALAAVEPPPSLPPRSPPPPPCAPVFSAYGDFHLFPRRVRDGCHRTGVTLVDVPRGGCRRKEAADKALLADMLLFALEHPPPSCLLLISRDADFAPALHRLRR